MRRQRGQVTALVAIMSTVLAGFVGLVIDVGGITSDHEEAQAAADGAALAAASAIGQGATIATATSYAQALVAQERISTSSLTLTFLNSSGVSTTDSTLVATITAAVSFSHVNRFLPLLGAATAAVAASAAGALPSPNCGVCLLGTGTALMLAGSSTLDVVNAGVADNSTNNSNLKVSSGATLRAQFVAVAANRVSNSGTISPSPVVRTAVSDPLASLAVPSVSGSATAVNVASFASQTIGPGVYSSITVQPAGTLTMNPGIYVLTGALTVNSFAVVTADNVTLHLACPGYPTPCSSGASGGNLRISGGTTTLTAPNTGTYAGVAVFGDRNNNAANTLGAGTLNLDGTFYTKSAPLSQTQSGATVTLTSQLIVKTLTIASSTVMTVTRVPSLAT